MFNKKNDKINGFFVCLTKNNLFIESSLKKLNNEISGNLEISEFHRFGDNYIINLDESDISFVQDKRRMANIPWQHLIKKDNTMLYVCYGVLALQVIMLIKG